MSLHRLQQSNEEFTVPCELIGSVKPSVALPGDDVILPCCLDSEVDLQDFTVEWSKLEVKPDPADRQGRVPFVYLYRNRKTMTKVMMETFIPRVSLDPDGLKRGDVTLKIRNVTLQDEGKYSCFIPGLNHRETVQLLVEPNGVRAPTMETSQFNISTPDPGGEQTNIWISGSRPGLWITLGLLASSILSAVWIFQKRRQKKPPLVKTSISVKLLQQPEIVREDETPTEPGPFFTSVFPGSLSIRTIVTFCAIIY